MSTSARIFSDRVSSFGRRRPFVLAVPAPAPAMALSDDLKLFGMTFLGGLLFMTVYLA